MYVCIYIYIYICTLWVASAEEQRHPDAHEAPDLTNHTRNKNNNNTNYIMYYYNYHYDTIMYNRYIIINIYNNIESCIE